MQFLSDNAAAVHPAVWAAMQAADEADAPYDNDSLSRTLDAAFADLFGRECAALWVASGTAANCLALATMVEPHGGVLCHEEAHIEMDEGGAPGFFLHGAKLMPLPGAQGKITPEAIAARRAQVRDGVHQVHPHAISITQATEVGCVYRPDEVVAIAGATQAGPGRRLGLHMDGARFANAVAFLGGEPGACLAGVDALSFGFIKNGAMSAEAIVLFDPAAADLARFRRKRAGHLQSKGRFLAAQILAMLEGDLWLANARAANAAAAELGVAAKDRLLHPVEANEVFVACSHDERQALRGAGFAFYDWGEHAARMVAAWDAKADHVAALARALASL